jgi:formylglycine-generating enzyme required for sulfatase activity
MKRFMIAIGIIVVFLLSGCPNPATSPADTVITLAAIPGVTVPVLGATPVTTITETAQYTGTVSWNGTPATFAASTAYTATITLTAKAGYTHSGVAANFFTVAGATSVTHSASSGVVTAVFPATDDGSYNSATIGSLKYVPAGTFNRDDAYTSTVSAFRMSQYEITRAQFLSIMGTDPTRTDLSSGTTDPVFNTNWYRAIAFCNKLSIAEGLIPVYSVSVGGTFVNFTTLTFDSIPIDNNDDWNAATAIWTNNGYRLPTEMEWMWAAMGATSDRSNGYTGTGTNTLGYTKGYAGSTEAEGAQVNIGNYAWVESNSGGTSHPVGGKAANELGLYDMNGNVQEWIWDWYGGYPHEALTDYRGVAWGTFRLTRGGAFGWSSSYCTISDRNPYYSYNVNVSAGIRVVRP